MKVIVPQIVNDEDSEVSLLYSNIYETDADEWDATEDYAVGDEVIVTTEVNDHRVFMAATAQSGRVPANIINEDCSSLDAWTDSSAGTGTATISPAGQFKLTSGTNYVQRGYNWWTNSPSLSPSMSPSNSPSESPSPSFGWTGVYTKYAYDDLPITDDLLTDEYTEADYENVRVNDDSTVSQTASRGATSADAQYAIHEFKEYVSSISNGNILCKAKSNCAPSTSPIYLQIYSYDSVMWKTLDSDNTTAADTELTLSATIADFTNYLDENNVATFRIYQRAGVIG